jgi:DNA-directed RNA polymerase subunit N (RpoN/RPB10)
MAQLEPMLCVGCGEPLSNKYELFLAMREAMIAYKSKGKDKGIPAENKYIQADNDDDLQEVFTALHIDNLCGRMHIANSVPASTLV